VTRRRIATCWTAVGVAWLLAAAGCKTTGAPATEAEMTPDDGLASVDAQAETPQQKPAGLEPVYFEFDRWQLTEDARQTLRGNADQIEQNPEWGVVTIEGHCDERGSDEYNLALGERRAAAVKRYFEDLGLPAKRLETVTFGEDKPAVAGHDESAWRYNRRSEMHSQALRLSGW
jgi:peptidoglycan-associated lipoprotein